VSAFLVAFFAEGFGFFHVSLDCLLAHASFREVLDGVSAHFSVFFPELVAFILFLLVNVIGHARAFYSTPEA
jgi:hypothetical protein